MQSTFITDEYSQDLSEVLQFAEARGVRSLELRSIDGQHCSAVSRERLTALRADLRGAGSSVCAIDSFAFKGAWSEDTFRTKGKEHVKRCLDVANLLEAPMLRVFAFWRDTAPSLSAIAEQLSELGEICAERDVLIVVENGTFSEVGSGERLAALLEMLEGQRIMALWDPGNVINGGWEEDVKSGLEALSGRVAHVHVKSPHRRDDGVVVFGPMCGGLIDFSDQLRQLAAQHYTGFLSLETHWRKGHELIGRDKLDFPVGHEFSYAAAPATEHMLGELNELIANLGLEP